MLLVNIKTSKIVYLLWPENSFFTPVINIIKNLLLLAANIYINLLDIKILIKNIVEDLLLLAVSIYINPPVLA